MGADTTEAIPHDYSERAVYLVSGAISIGDEKIEPGQMAVLKPGADATIHAQLASSIVIIGGEPLGERFLDWNFVSSSRERLNQARNAWIHGEMKLPDGETETIAYPEYLLNRRSAR